MVHRKTLWLLYVLTMWLVYGQTFWLIHRQTLWYVCGQTLWLIYTQALWLIYGQILWLTMGWPGDWSIGTHSEQSRADTVISLCADITTGPWVYTVTDQQTNLWAKMPLLWAMKRLSFSPITCYWLLGWCLIEPVDTIEINLQQHTCFIPT